MYLQEYQIAYESEFISSNFEFHDESICTLTFFLVLLFNHLSDYIFKVPITIRRNGKIRPRSVNGYQREDVKQFSSLVLPLLFDICGCTADHKGFKRGEMETVKLE